VRACPDDAPATPQRRRRPLAREACACAAALPGRRQGRHARRVRAHMPVDHCFSVSARTTRTDTDGRLPCAPPGAVACHEAPGLLPHDAPHGVAPTGVQPSLRRGATGGQRDQARGVAVRRRSCPATVRKPSRWCQEPGGDTPPLREHRATAPNAGTLSARAPLDSRGCRALMASALRHHTRLETQPAGAPCVGHRRPCGCALQTHQVPEMRERCPLETTRTPPIPAAPALTPGLRRRR